MQIAGPTAAFATTVAGIVATKGMNALMIATIMAGLILIIMGLCRMGRFIKYIPVTIVEGFTAGKIMWVKKHEPENYARCKRRNDVRIVHHLYRLCRFYGRYVCV